MFIYVQRKNLVLFVKYKKNKTKKATSSLEQDREKRKKNPIYL